MRSSPLSSDPDSQTREARELALFVRLRDGDVRAFEEIFRAYMEPLCVCAYAYVQSQTAAEEVVHDLFARLWARRRLIATPRNLRAYLYRATRNAAINYLRRRRAEEVLKGRLIAYAPPPRSTPPAAEHELHVAGIAEALEMALADMPARCREVYTLTREGGLSYGEVANVLKLSPKTVENHMGRALAFLRERLAPWLKN